MVILCMVCFCIFQIISPNNVAIYGGLCALATFERQELQKKVLSSRYIAPLTFHGDAVGGLCLSVVVLCNKLYHLVSCICSSFKLFLELEPQLRDVLYKFHESQYAACLKLLDEMKVQYSLLNSQPRIMHFPYSDWFTQSWLSAHIP